MRDTTYYKTENAGTQFRFTGRSRCRGGKICIVTFFSCPICCIPFSKIYIISFCSLILYIVSMYFTYSETRGVIMSGSSLAS